MPAYHSAVDALKSLDKKDIQEVKSYAKPPELVQMVMEAVCILLDAKPDWNEAKKLLADTSFMDRLQTYDKDHIDPKAIGKIRKGYTSKPNFIPDVVGKVSSAARSLCMWVRAMDTYSRVATQVAPKKAKLDESTAKLNDAQSMLRDKQAALAEVEARVAALKQKLQAAERKAQELQEKETDVQKKLERAGKLVGGLGSERERWENLCVKLERSQDNLIGNVVLCSGAIAYQGPFTADYRQELSAGWTRQAKQVSIPCEDNFSVTGVLGDPVTIREWGVHGLPSDQLSIENAIFVTRSRRWPLMIDPQGQANSWIKRMERDSKLSIIKLSQGDYLRKLEAAIRVGLPVLLENVEEQLEPSIDPVLLKQVFRQSGRNLIRLGDTDVDYSDDFKLYITTKLANPHYPPEICIKVTIVNFTVTFSGLENQLLAECAALERPDLEERKEKLVLTIASGRRTMADLENKILKMLAEASGNILDDEDLINTLDSSKKTSSETEKAVSAAEETSQEIDAAREEYRPVASRGSIIYFVVADFASVDAMYQYSLPYFKTIFANTIVAAADALDLQARLRVLIDAITRAMYVMICRGLFERHKALFAFMIAVQIARHAGQVSDPEWKLFLQPAVLGVPHLPKPTGDDASWLDERTWAFLCAADDIPSLFGLAEHVRVHLAAWRVRARSVLFMSRLAIARRGAASLGTHRGEHASLAHALRPPTQDAASLATGRECAPRQRPCLACAVLTCARFNYTPPPPCGLCMGCRTSSPPSRRSRRLYPRRGVTSSDPSSGCWCSSSSGAQLAARNVALCACARARATRQTVSAISSCARVCAKAGVIRSQGESTRA
jgi:dynein heavy chain